MKNVMRDFKNQFNGPVLEFSFTMEDSGPGLAWLGSKPKVEVVAKAIAGQLLIKGIVFEEGTLVPELLHPKFPLPAAGTAGTPPAPVKPFGTARATAPVAPGTVPSKSPEWAPRGLPVNTPATSQKPVR